MTSSSARPERQLTRTKLILNYLTRRFKLIMAKSSTFRALLATCMVKFLRYRTLYLLCEGLSLNTEER